MIPTAGVGEPVAGGRRNAERHAQPGLARLGSKSLHETVLLTTSYRRPDARVGPRHLPVTRTIFASRSIRVKHADALGRGPLGLLW
jgi:hypothetical protein